MGNRVTGHAWAVECQEHSPSLLQPHCSAAPTLPRAPGICPQLLGQHEGQSSLTYKWCHCSPHQSPHGTPHASFQHSQALLPPGKSPALHRTSVLSSGPEKGADPWDSEATEVGSSLTPTREHVWMSECGKEKGLESAGLRRHAEAMVRPQETAVQGGTKPHTAQYQPHCSAHRLPSPCFICMSDSIGALTYLNP